MGLSTLSASDYLRAQVLNHILRTNTFAKPSAIYVALLRASRGTWTASTVYSVGDTIIPTTFAGRMYRCTTGGTSGSSQPTWTTTDGGTTNDGSVVWTEHTLSMRANTNMNEVTGSGYGRIAVTQADANWTDPASLTTIDNVNEIAFGSPTADWGTICFAALYDAVTTGNLLAVGPMSSVFVVNNGNPAPKFLAGACDVSFG